MIAITMMSKNSKKQSESNFPNLMYRFSIACAAAANVVAIIALKAPRPSNPGVYQAIQGELYHDALLISIGFTIPILIALLWVTIRGRLVSVNNEILAPRWLLACSLQICDIIIFRSLNSTDSTYSDPRIRASVESFKLAAFICCTSAIICKQSKSSIKGPASVLSPSFQCLLLVLLSTSFHVFCSLRRESSTEQDDQFTFTAKAIICLIATQVVVLMFCCLYTFIKRSTTVSKNASAVDGEDTVVAICLVMLSLRVVSSAIVVNFCSSFHGGFYAFSDATYICDLCIQLVAMLGITVFPWWLHEWGILRFLEAVVIDNSSFLRYIAHEVRSPLNIAELSVSFLKAETKCLASSEHEGKYDAVVDAIADVESGCKSAVSILNDVLEFDKMKGGKMELQFEDLGPKTLFGEYFKQYLIAAKQSKIDFTVEYTDDEGQRNWSRKFAMRVDSVRFAQVVRNLLTNAFKFTPAHGTVKMIISKVEGPAAGEVLLRLAVVDSGVGLSTEQLQKLFGHYVQFNANKLQKGGGSGLGLWIAKGIVTLHGGRLWAESEGEGQGSTFFLEIPLFEHDHESAPEREQEPVPSTRPSPSLMMAGSGGPEGRSRPATPTSMASPQHSKEDSKHASTLCKRPSALGLSALAHTSPRDEPRWTLEGLGLGLPKRPSSLGLASHSSVESLKRLLAMEEGTEDPRDGDRFSATSFVGTSTDRPGCKNQKAGSDRSFKSEKARSERSCKSDESGSDAGGRIFDSGLSRMIDRAMPKLPKRQQADSRGKPDSCGGSDFANPEEEEMELCTFLGIPLDMSISTQLLNSYDDREHTASFSSAPATGPSGGGPVGCPSLAVQHQQQTTVGSNSSYLLLSQHPPPNAEQKFVEVSPEQVEKKRTGYEQGLQVLVADDSTATRKVLGNLLEQRGHSVSFACDGFDLLYMLGMPPSGANGAACGLSSHKDPKKQQRRVFDAILVDRHMPGLGGAQAIRHLRNGGYTGLVIGMTAFAKEADWDLFRDSGADEVLAKPFDLDVFAAVVAQFRTGRFQRPAVQSRSEPAVAVTVSARLKPVPAFDNYQITTAATPAPTTAAAAAADAANEMGRDSKREAKPGLKKTLHVLVVEDSKPTRKVMGRFLTQRGHTVSFAEDGKDFLSVMHGAHGKSSSKGSPLALGLSVSLSPSHGRVAPSTATAAFDVVLMDRHMPHLEGPEASRLIREQGYTGLIVGLTGDGSDEDARYFMEHGANAVMTKPFDLDDFDKIVQRFFE